MPSSKAALLILPPAALQCANHVANSASDMPTFGIEKAPVITNFDTGWRTGSLPPPMPAHFHDSLLWLASTLTTSPPMEKLRSSSSFDMDACGEPPPCFVSNMNVHFPVLMSAPRYSNRPVRQTQLVSAEPFGFNMDDEPGTGNDPGTTPPAASSCRMYISCPVVPSSFCSYEYPSTCRFHSSVMVFYLRPVTAALRTSGIGTGCA